MKTSRHPPSSGFPRHLRDTRLFRKILKSQHAAAYDISASSKNPQQHGAPTYCTGRDSLNWMGPVELQKKAEEQIITEIEITPPPPYHEDPDVTRFRPTAHETDHDATSLGTTVLMALPPLPAANHQRAATYSPFSSLDDIHLPRSTSTAALFPPTTGPPRPPHRHRRSAESLLPSYQPTRPATPIRHHRPIPHLPSHASPLRSHPIHPDPTAPPPPKPLPALKRRAYTTALLATGLLSPIREEPAPPPVDRRTTRSILRHRSRSRSSSPTRCAAKRVRFASALPDDDDEEEEEDACTAELRKRDRLFLIPTVLVSLLLVLALSEVIDGVVVATATAAVRVEYVGAFVVGCGIAQGMGPAVVRGVGEVLGSAREEGWV